MISLIFWSGVASADLTKQDIEEIRRVVREEVQQEVRRVDERIDGLDSKLSTRIDSLDKHIDGLDSKLSTRIDSLEKRIDDLRNLLYVILAGMFALVIGMLGLVGFILWDRRTALAPAVKKIEVLEKKEDRLEGALKEFAQKEPRLAEALRFAGIL